MVSKHKINNESNWDIVMKVLLLYIYNYDDIEYNAFVTELLTKNRYHNSQKMIAFLERVSEEAKKYIKIFDLGELLYRARIDDGSLGESTIKDLLVNGLGFDDDFSNEDKKILRFDKIEEITTAVAILSDETMKEKFIKWFNAFRDRKFQGYDEKGSLSPPSEASKEGRLNPSRISYLYTSTSQETALIETKAYKGQVISLATITPTIKLKILDLTQVDKIYGEYKEQELKVENIISVISKKFSTPNQGNVVDYIPTQYLAEFFKTSLGVDGIKFSSSLSSDGSNIVFFSDQYFKVIKTTLVKIDNINIKFSDLFNI